LLLNSVCVANSTLPAIVVDASATQGAHDASSSNAPSISVDVKLSQLSSIHIVEAHSQFNVEDKILASALEFIII